MNFVTFYAALLSMLDWPSDTTHEAALHGIATVKARADVSEARAQRIANLEAELAERRKEGFDTFAKMDRLVRLSAMVDDLLAEAGYDTIADTREACLEALRQDIKVKLGTAPPADIDMEALATKLAEAAMPGNVGVLNRDFWLRVAKAARKHLNVDGLVVVRGYMIKAAAEAREQRDAARKKAEANAIAQESNWEAYQKTRDAYRETMNLLQRVVAERDTQKQMRLDLAAEQDKLVAALDEAQDQLVAERKKWPELKAEVERLKKLVRTHELTISLFGNIIHGHAAPTATQKCADTGLESHIAPDVRARLAGLLSSHADMHMAIATISGKVNPCSEIGDLHAWARATKRRLDELFNLETQLRTSDEIIRGVEGQIADLREANRELADAAIKKPLDRDRVRLALLDYTEHHTYAHLINEMADHLVKRLA